MSPKAAAREFRQPVASGEAAAGVRTDVPRPLLNPKILRQVSNEPPASPDDRSGEGPRDDAPQAGVATSDEVGLEGLLLRAEAEASLTEGVICMAEARLHAFGATIATLRAKALALGIPVSVSAAGSASRRLRAKRDPELRTATIEQAMWLGIHRAAEALDEDAESLRKKLERASKRHPDGHIEAEINGVRGRKLGHLWKVQLPPGWTVGGGR